MFTSASVLLLLLAVRPEYCDKCFEFWGFVDLVSGCDDDDDDMWSSLPSSLQFCVSVVIQLHLTAV